MARSTLQVQGTNDNSTLSKLSASAAGYFHDPFLALFATKSPSRAPLINWGYWIRFQAIDKVVKWFLGSEGHHVTQIVSLGAGFDTLYFRLKTSNLLSNCHYYEIDYPSVVDRKQKIIDSNPVLHNLADTGNYKLLGCDLTMLSDFESSLDAAGVNTDVTTLLLAEVVLTYIPPNYVNSLLGWSANYFTKAVFSVYEQINPFDGFGQVMLKHFQTLSSPLLNIHHYPTSISQCQRYENAGWSKVYSCDMNQLYFSLPLQLRQQIATLEQFDEYEEWHLKCAHYHILCSFTGSWPCYIDLPLSLNGSEIVVSEYERVSPHMVIDTWLLKRYGHSSVKLAEDSLLVYGGFGYMSSGLAHGRLDSVVVLKKESNEWLVEQVEVSGKGPGRLMYHTMSSLLDSIFVIGGRGSPQVPNSDIYTLKCNNGSWAWSKRKYGGDEFIGRWRHTAIPIDDRYIIVIGGCTTNGQILNDVLLIDTHIEIIRKLPVNLPKGRHSHVAIKCNDASILIIGGLDQELLPVSDCLQLMLNEPYTINKLEFLPQLPIRYSMSSCLMNDMLLLVGGVSLNCSVTSDVIVIDLKHKTWISKKFQYPIDLPLPLLHGHTSQLIDKDVIVIGGGGNCFSFGTHFNQSLIIHQHDLI